MDRDYADNSAAPGAPRFEHALFVKSHVISRGAAHAVIDAGHKSHALDSGPPRLWAREGSWANGGDEHGIVRPAPGRNAASLPALGDTVWLVPGHCDPTVNLHDRYVCVRGGLERGIVEAVWPIEARGCVG
jgi:D-serine deaminase-like pyridoxal phosphate-dependent protein